MFAILLGLFAIGGITGAPEATDEIVIGVTLGALSGVLWATGVTRTGSSVLSTTWAFGSSSAPSSLSSSSRAPWRA